MKNSLTAAIEKVDEKGPYHFAPVSGNQQFNFAQENLSQKFISHAAKP